MRLSSFGGVVQFCPGSEGDILLRAGLIGKREVGHQVEVYATLLLESCFAAMPDFTSVYPLLVEMVCSRRMPEIVNPAEVLTKLQAMGLQNVLTIELAIRSAFDPRARQVN